MEHEVDVWSCVIVAHVGSSPSISELRVSIGLATFGKANLKCFPELRHTVNLQVRGRGRWDACSP